MKIHRDKLDVLFSEFIRTRALKTVGGCERCFTPKISITQLQCAHFIGRSRKQMRWDEDNAAGLCFGCHSYLTSHPLEAVEWFRQRLGQKGDLLQARARITYPRPDRVGIELYLREKLKELK